MARASCLCGAVQWQMEAPLQSMTHCHCSRCRKTHGAAFGTCVAAPAAGFRLTGDSHIAAWEAAGGAPRCFCGRCGSVVPGVGPGALSDTVFAPAGNFLEDPGIRPELHIFAGSRAPWFTIEDDLPQFETAPAEFGLPNLPALPASAAIDPLGRPRGSCLCGSVAFVLTSEAKLARHCHCERCRRARSAAHASNLILAADGVQFTRGENLLASYKVPEAKFFTQVFCTKCGSPMPRTDGSRDIAVVPMGALDDDPGVAPDLHIFVDSKAPWYTIPGSLPQHAEY
jgi:hypothetical protein